MKFKLSKIIQHKDLNFFTVLYFFLIFLAFTLSKGLIKNEELSDLTFFTSCIILTELIYLFIANNKINYKLIYFNDYLIILIFFLFIFIIWNSEIIYSYRNILIFFTSKLLLTIPLVVLINYNGRKKIFNNKLDFFSQILILSIFFSGLFYQTNYSSLNLNIIVILISILVLIFALICSKINKWLNIVLSLIIFFLLLKAFLLSSDKDAFHYSWFLGPINSLSAEYKLLNNIPSQYGYLNILFINKLSSLINVNSTNTLIGFILILFCIFFKIFYSKLKSIINLPIIIISLFLSFLIFGNVGYSNLAGTMFIPSSSVFRFLPSLITILLLSEILNKNKNKNILLFCFLFSFLISLLWSFESAVFVIFSLASYYLVKLIIYFFDDNTVNKNFSFNFKRSTIEILIGISMILIFFLFIHQDNFELFYEHALKTKGSLSKEISSNKVTLVFLFLLMLSYLILRDSYQKKSIFNLNFLWFSLFVAYSSYFLLRSVDNNLFNILPFLLFIICSMKVNSQHIKNLRIYSIYTVVFFVIVSSLLSATYYKEKFVNNLMSSNYFNTPQFYNESYLPSSEILNTIKKFPDLPLTLITGKTIHEKNFHLPNQGYGLPILPLEHFNILNINTKERLMDNYFSINPKHLLLCVYDCKFYSSEEDKNTYSKIFIGKNLKYKKIIETYTKNSIEILYILSIK